MRNSYQEAFYRSFVNIMPQFGFNNIKRLPSGNCSSNIDSSAIAVSVGIDGDLKGNVIYVMDTVCALKIASIFQKRSVETFDQSAQRALSTLACLLAENASAILNGWEVTVDISVATLMHGDFSINLCRESISHYPLIMDGIPLSIYVSLIK